MWGYCVVVLLASHHGSMAKNMHEDPNPNDDDALAGGTGNLQ